MLFWISVSHYISPVFHGVILMNSDDDFDLELELEQVDVLDFEAPKKDNSASRALLVRRAIEESMELKRMREEFGF